MKMTFREMQEAFTLRSHLIRSIIFDLCKLHELPSALESASPNMIYSSISVYKDGEYTDKQYYDYSLYDTDWDGMSHHFNVELPIELVETFTDEQIKEWFTNYFENLNVEKRKNDLRHQFWEIKHYINKYSLTIKDVESLLECDDDDNWNEFVEKFANKI